MSLENIMIRIIPRMSDLVAELTLMRKTMGEAVTAVRELARVMEKRMEDVYRADTE